ncbi:MAG: hypothetical protein HFF52_06995 [Lawsonibacter sp.]|nr:hypothetical protein [Lawsonibacter sp.]
MDGIYCAFTANDILQGEFMAVCHDGVSYGVRKGELQIFKGNVCRQDNSARPKVNTGLRAYTTDGNRLVDYPRGAVALVVVGHARPAYFDNIAMVGACHDFSKRFCVPNRDRSGLAARGQRRAWKCGGYDTSCQQSRRNPKPCSVIQIFPPFLLQALRACLKNVNTPKQRLFFRRTAPIFLEIHPGFLRKIVFVWRKNPSPLCTFPFFKQRLARSPAPGEKSCCMM